MFFFASFEAKAGEGDKRGISFFCPGIETGDSTTIGGTLLVDGEGEGEDEGLMKGDGDGDGEFEGNFEADGDVG